MSTGTVLQPIRTPKSGEPAGAQVERWLFAAAIALGSFLLFSVQLMIGKYILPWFGGTAGVWTTCLLFFQSTLLAGYWYAHASVQRFAPRAQAGLHIGLLLASVALMTVAAFAWPSPITPGASWKPQNGEIAVWLILRVLMVSVGVSVTLVATTGPLVQHWFTRVYPGESPYRLYALSNAGSLLGLLSYPAVVERTLKLHTQAWLWSAGYGVYVVVTIGCAVLATRRSFGQADSDAKAPNPTASPSRSQTLLWFSLAALGSLMLVATTRFITEDLAPIPLLWMLPLAVYLVSFIVCFDHSRWYRPGAFHVLLLATSALSIAIYHGIALRVWTFVGAFLLVLFACCMFCHGELYRRRPAPEHLTSFYLMIALGGAAGSAFVNLIAPLLFKGYWEMQIGVAACLITMAVTVVRDGTSWANRKNMFVPLALAAWTLLTAAFWLSSGANSLTQFVLRWPVAIAAVLAVVLTALAFRANVGLAEKFPIDVRKLTAACLYTAVGAASLVMIWAGTFQYRHSNWAHRNFYGTLYVQQETPPDARFSFYVLTHSNTFHGTQLIAPELRKLPTSYYHKKSGVGLALTNYPHSAGNGLRVGVIGLGVGTLATYGQPGDVYRFYEIDPEVISVASGQGSYFSFLSDSKAHVEIVEGDGRVSLERELAQGHPQNYDVFVIDAFNGDVVPVHLLTEEAFEVYLHHLRDANSVIAVHVSNRSVELASVIAAEAEHFGLHTAFINAAGFTNASVPEGIISANQWILLSRSANVLSLPPITQASSPLQLRHGLHFWTDDRSNLLQILR